MSKIIVHCKFDELVDPKSLKDHPKNRNKHGSDQVERLAEMYAYHGIRHPIVVSKRSGFIVAGHGRKLAAIRAGVEIPVVYQDFDSDEAEYAFIQADNAIALWSDLDLSGINMDLPDLGPDFDLNMLGIESFDLDPPTYEIEDPEEEDKEDSGITKIIIHLRSEEYIETMSRVKDVCHNAGIEDMTRFFLEALTALEQKTESRQ